MKRNNISILTTVVMMMVTFFACQKESTRGTDSNLLALKSTIYVPARQITITASSNWLSPNGGSAMIKVTQFPANADTNYVLAIVSGAECASLNNKVLTALKEGIVVVKATTENHVNWDLCTIIISNQPFNPEATKGLVTYYWDGANFPQSAWQENVIIPGSQGSPRNNGQPLGSDGWETAVEYNNLINTFSHQEQRYAHHASVHLICNPSYPAVPDSVGPANFRTEVLLTPFHYLIPVPSEQWISWSYFFPDMNNFFDASADGEGAIHQLHASNRSPVVELWHHGSWGNNLIISNRFGDGINQSQVAFNTHYAIGSGHWVDFIEHVQWAIDSTGLYELWIVEKGIITKVRTYHGPNTFSNPEDGNGPYGGTPKLGFYHYAWHGYGDSISNAGASANVAAYRATGGAQLEMFLGPVRIFNRPQGFYNPIGFLLVNPGSYK